MAAYIMIDRLSVTDPEGFGAYHLLAPATVQSHGGRYVLPHSTRIEALEGNWKPTRIILIEFDDADQAKGWWNSPDYAEARALHHDTTISNVILVEGTLVEWDGSPARELPPRTRRPPRVGPRDA